MTNAERAELAGEVFVLSDHYDQENDTLTNLYDFVCDLLHYADTLFPEERGEWDTSNEGAGYFVSRMALNHYVAELSEAAEEEAINRSG